MVKNRETWCAACSPWGLKEPDTTEWLNNNNKISQTEEDKYQMIVLICGILKMQMSRNKSREQKTNLWLSKGMGVCVWDKVGILD